MDGGLCATYNTAGFTTSGGAGYIQNLAPDFLEKLPTDPRNSIANASATRPTCRESSGSNCYLYNSDGTDYKLLAHCTPEGTMKKDDPFFDPCRPNWAWQISSSSRVIGILNAAGTGCDSTGW